MKIVHVVGARPNFMKMAPLYKAILPSNFKQVIVHTGQHYSENMSDVFFRELGIPNPDINLHVGSGSHAYQVAHAMIKLEEYFLKNKVDLVLVYGDINSTLATSLVCSKLNIKTAHVEAGLRSYDMNMPEEINRIVTDRISDFYFTPSKDGDENLLREGVDKNKIHLVGNVMIDTLVQFLKNIEADTSRIKQYPLYGVVTIHRPSNVDDLDQLKKIVASLNTISKKVTLFFPIHPRTRKQLEQLQNIDLGKNIVLIDPLGYIEFMNLVYYSKFVITDSGGIQEETTYLDIPCLTLRENTERPITVTEGTNTLIGKNYGLLQKQVAAILSNKYKHSKRPKKWDGKASVRIAKIITKILS